jgi:phosphohistidine phosphatase SixA
MIMLVPSLVPPTAGHARDDVSCRTLRLAAMAMLALTAAALPSQAAELAARELRHIADRLLAIGHKPTLNRFFTRLAEEAIGPVRT